MYHRLHFSQSRYPFFLCHWEQRTGGNLKLVGMSENHSVETGVPPKTRFCGQGTPRPDSVYVECSREIGHMLERLPYFSKWIFTLCRAIKIADAGNASASCESASDLQLLLESRMKCFNNLAAAQLKVIHVLFQQCVDPVGKKYLFLCINWTVCAIT